MQESLPSEYRAGILVLERIESSIIQFQLSIAQEERSHAAGDSQGGHDGREDADDELQDEFPGFFIHSGYRL